MMRSLGHRSRPPFPARRSEGPALRSEGPAPSNRPIRRPGGLRGLRALTAILGIGLGSLGAIGSTACGHTYTLPDRDTPVEVWVEAPAAASTPVTVNLLVYVGDRKAIDGPVQFAAGQVRQRVATLYMRGGKQDVSVVIGGRAVATDSVDIQHRAWIVVTVAGNEAKVSATDREPGTAK